MFKFLKDKLKQAVEKFSQSTKEEVDDAPEEVIQDEDVTEDISSESLKDELTDEEDVDEEDEPDDGSRDASGDSDDEDVSDDEDADSDDSEDDDDDVEDDDSEEEGDVSSDDISDKEPDSPDEEDTFEHDAREEESALEDSEDESDEEDVAEDFSEEELTIEEDTLEDDESSDDDAEEDGKDALDESEDKPEEVVKDIPEKREDVVPRVEKKQEVKPAPEAPKKTGFFGRIKQTFTTKSITADKFDDLFFDLEIALLENNVALEVVERIKDDLKEELVDKPLPRGGIELKIQETLENTLRDVLSVPTFDLLERAAAKKPFVVCFVGINGAGKTTTIAKVAQKFLDNDKTVVLAAADTFRAAAIEQLQTHADRLGVKIIKHTYGADPAAVAYDAIAHAKAQQRDVVLIDTAGRLHTNQNLLEEMKKIMRVAQPDLKVFVGESITGNDCIEQAKHFNEAIGIDAIILSKADVDEKGGTPLSISYVLQKPIIYLGSGQTYRDLKAFDPEDVLKTLGISDE